MRTFRVQRLVYRLGGAAALPAVCPDLAASPALEPPLLGAAGLLPAAASLLLAGGTFLWAGRQRALRRAAENRLRSQQRREDDLARELADTKARLVQLFENSPLGMVLFDAADPAVPYRIVDCNEVTCRLHGYEKQAVAGQSLGFLEADFDPREMARETAQLRERGHAVGIARRRRADGSVFSVEYVRQRFFTGSHELVLGMDRDISERLRAEAELRASEERFRLIVETCPAGFWDYNELTGEAYYSPRWKALLGYADAELPNEKGLFDRLLHPDDHRLLRLPIDRRAPTAKHFAVEFRLRHRDGSWRWIESHGVELRDASGRFLRALGFHTDITDRRRHREVLEESQARYRALFEDAAIPLWLEDFSAVGRWFAERRAEGVEDFDLWLRAHPERLREAILLIRILAANRACRAFHGAEELDELTGLFARVPESSLEVFRRELVALASGHTVFESEMEVLTLGGERRHVLMVLRVMPGHEAALSRVLVSTINLTARVAAEEKLRRTEEFQRLVLEATNEGIFQWEIASEAFRLSPRCGELLGLSEEELTDDREAWWQRQHPDDIAAADEAVGRHLRQGEPLRHTSRFFHKDGGVRWLFCRAATRRASDGRPLVMVGSYADVTDLKRIDEELQQTRKLRAMGELVGGIAHEFNNLLTPMLLQASYLAEQRRGDTTAVEALTPILSAARRAKELTQRILLFSRRQDARLEWARLPAIVESTLDIVRQTIDRRIQFVVRLEAGLPPVRMDAVDVGQVVMNLVLNARDALAERLAGETGPAWRPEIALEVARTSGPPGRQAPSASAATRRWQRLTVRDNGPGMAPEVKERIFEPFFTTKGAGQGTGLGLSTAWHAVERLGGWIDVESQPGAGAAFHVYLPDDVTPPAGAGAPAAAAGTASPFAAAPLSGSAAARRLLLVDDDPMVGDVTCKLLTRLGYEVAWVRSGEEAVGRFCDGTDDRFSAVMTDLNMPGLAGDDFVSWLRSRHYPGKILVMSGHVSEETQARLEALRVDGILAKPYEYSQFKRVMTELWR